MTDLERMASEAGFAPVEESDMPWRAAGWAPNFARLEALIRADERERCAKVCAPDGFDEGTADNDCAYAHADARRQCAAEIRAQ